MLAKDTNLFFAIVISLRSRIRPINAYFTMSDRISHQVLIPSNRKPIAQPKLRKSNWTTEARLTVKDSARARFKLESKLLAK